MRINPLTAGVLDDRLEGFGVEGVPHANVFTAAGVATRDFAWLRRNTPDDAACVILDVTSAEACIGVMGPQARALMQSVSPNDLSNEAFPFGTAQTISVGMGDLRAHRISYVGELGWELYPSADMAVHIFDTLSEAGAEHGLRLCGYHTLDSCRMEKAFRHFGHDITDEDHVLEAGLGFAVRTDKAEGRFGPFMGREAVLRRRESGLERRLLQFCLADSDALIYHNEPILRDGQVVGRLTSGAYGHALGAAVGLGYVPCRPEMSAQEVLEADYAIDVAGNLIPAKASLRPLYDPKATRMRA